MKQILIALTLSISACQTIDKTIEKYQDHFYGKDISGAVKEYGPADEVTDVYDGKVYQWTRKPSATSQDSCVIQLRATANGKINHVNLDGDAC